jgi:transketolase
MLFSRQKLPILPREQTAGKLSQGAYVLSDCQGAPDILLLASGAEVHQALGAQEILKGRGVAARVINMPSWELFEQQPDSYKRSVLPPDIKARVAVEAGAPFGWERYVGDHGIVIGITGFGASAPGGRVLAEFGFTTENVAARALDLLKK